MHYSKLLAASKDTPEHVKTPNILPKPLNSHKNTMQNYNYAIL